MTNAPGPQTITPERQQAAQQIGAVFNSLHEYLHTLEHKAEDGEAMLTKHLEFAHQRIDEAAMWTIKHVLTFGTPPKAAAPEAPPAAPAANETPAPIGVVDPAQALPTANASGAEPV
jgi:hypothetical protein